MFIGIIAEFNPFHKGHLHLVNSVKENNKIISIMSGDYVVRGEFAIYDKFTRATSAYKAGVDAVFELASVFSIQNAEEFSRNAIRHLKHLGIDAICFGAENPDSDFLDYACEIVDEINSDLINKKIKLENISYSNFVKNYIHKETHRLIGSNDMLALEYLRQIKIQNLNIKILPIKRIVSEYNSSHYTEYSATSIRKHILSNNNLLTLNDVLPIIKSIGPLTKIDTENLVESEINKIYDAIFNSTSYQDIIKNSTHKRLSVSRLQRALLKSILGIDSLCEKKYRNTILLKPLAINKNNNILNTLDKNKLYTSFKNIDILDDDTRELYFINEKHSEFYHSLTDNKKLLDRTNSPFI